MAFMYVENGGQVELMQIIHFSAVTEGGGERKSYASAITLAFSADLAISSTSSNLKIQHIFPK